MQVQKIQSNNRAFGAKFIVKGAKLNLNKYDKAELTSMAKKIGKGTDKIEILLGKVTSEPYSQGVGELSCATFISNNLKSRSINATSNINGITKEESLGFYRTVFEDTTPEQFTIKRIKNYLKDLLSETENNPIYKK